MKNEQIIEMAAKAVENYREGDFFIGSKVDEILPNGKVSLICVDCSWLKPQQTPIIDRNDLDEIGGQDYKKPSIKIDCDDFILTYWFDMIDMDGDIHHCKIESFIDTSGDPFDPIVETSYAVYIEV